MQLKTILNRIHPVKGFMYAGVRWTALEHGLGIEVDVRPRSGMRSVCSGCDTPRPGYDTLATHRFAFVPLWGILVWLAYAMRRVQCPNCGIKVERVPWARVDLTGLTAIGIDEIMAWRGHKYLTLVYQIDEEGGRLLWVGNERTAKTLLRFFRCLVVPNSGNRALSHTWRSSRVGINPQVLLTR